MLDTDQSAFECLVVDEFALEQCNFACRILDIRLKCSAGLGLLDNIVGGCARSFDVGLELSGLGNPAVDVWSCFTAQRSDFCL